MKRIKRIKHTKPTYQTSKKRKIGIPTRYLKQIFTSLPYLKEKEIIILQQYASAKTYKILTKDFISKSMINELKKEANALMEIAAELKDDIESASLIEEDT